MPCTVSGPPHGWWRWHHRTMTQHHDHTTSHKWRWGPSSMSSHKHPAPPPINSTGQQCVTTTTCEDRQHTKRGDPQSDRQWGSDTRRGGSTQQGGNTWRAGNMGRGGNMWWQQDANGQGPSLATHAQQHPPAPALPALHQPPTTLFPLHQFLLLSSPLHHSSSVPPPSITPQHSPITLQHSLPLPPLPSPSF